MAFSDIFNRKRRPLDDPEGEGVSPVGGELAGNAAVRLNIETKFGTEYVFSNQTQFIGLTNCFFSLVYRTIMTVTNKDNPIRCPCGKSS